MAFFAKKKQDKEIKYAGVRRLLNGNTSVIVCEKELSDAAATYLSSSPFEMGVSWEQEKANGHLNISNRPLISIQAEDYQAAAAVTAGFSLSGLRASQFNSSTQTIASMHESMMVAAGKRLPYVLSIACKATTKATANIYCSHDEYHHIDDTGFIQFFARNNQAVADLTVISRKIAELSLNPAVVAQDGFLTAQLIEPLHIPERELIKEFAGLPDDIIDTPTPAQAILFGKTRRRVPELWSVDQPIQSGAVQNADSYMQTVAGQRPYFFDHVVEIAEQCLGEWFELTGRRYQRINQYHCDDADYLIVAQGSILTTAETTADFLRAHHKLKVGVIDMTMFRPFPGDLISHLIKRRKGVLVLERSDRPLAEDLPIISEIRSCVGKAIDNAKTDNFTDYASYNKLSDVAPLYSACFGLGGHELQVADIIAAVENMQPNAKQQKFVYLGMDFVRNNDLPPQQEIQQQALTYAYPEINELSLKGLDKPELIAEKTIVLTLHSYAGWESVSAGESLAQTLFEHFNLEVIANPSFDIEKKGQPTVYHITASSEPLKLTTQQGIVDVVISPDPNIFSHCNPLTRLSDGGILIIQSSLNDEKALWGSFPENAQKTIIKKQLEIYFIDSLKVVKELSSIGGNIEFRSNRQLQNAVFNAVVFKVADFSAYSDKSEEDLQVLADDNLDLVKSSYKHLKQLRTSDLSATAPVTALAHERHAPLLLQRKLANNSAIANIHRFWNHLDVSTNSRGNVSDPFVSLGVVPAATGIFGDMTSNRLQHPEWVPENCTACGDCYSVCPDSAIPGLINTVNEVFETNIKRIEKAGHTVRHLRRAIRIVEKKYHALTTEKSEGTTLDPIFAKAIGDTIKEYAEAEREALTIEFDWFKETIGSFKFALTQPYHDEMNSRMPRSGGLFSITINPNSCKGCMECVSVCETDALSVVKQTDDSTQTLRDNWSYWLDLPTSNKKYSRIDDLQAKKGALNTLLLDKKNHDSMFNGDDSRMGSGEKIAIHLLTGTVTALMQPRVEQHIKYINQLIVDMEKHIHLKLAETLDISDVDALETAIDENQNVDLTLSRLSGSMDNNRATQPIDPDWLKWALQLVAKLKQLKGCYSQGRWGDGRASLGMTEGYIDTSARVASFPYNPYPFPWARHLSNDASALAMGLFEGHMMRMAEGFKTIRMAELEIKEKYDKSEHEQFFARFDWRQFSDEEYLLCPPMVTLGADGTSSDSGFQGLSSSLLSSKPIKILVLDNQLPVNFEATRKELALVSLAHRTAYVQQSSISNTAHLIEGYIDGLNYRGPALWSVYTSNQPENGLANNSLVFQSKLSVESRAYPLISFDPRLGKTWEECISLLGNPDIDQDWVIYTLDYTDEYGNKFSMDVPLTYADWALTEVQFAQHFTAIAEDAGAEEMVLLSDYIAADQNTQGNNVPFIWAVDPQTNHLLKVIVSADMVKATRERQTFWQTLKGLSGDSRVEVDLQAVADQARAEMAQTITEGLMSMVGGDASALTRVLAEAPAVDATSSVVPPVKKPVLVEKTKTEPKPEKKTAKKTKAEPNAKAAHEPVWIETPDCTTCDECVEIAPAMFQYDSDKKAIVVDPTAGTFEDIVRSAEKCTAVIIHPGTPWNPDEPNLESLIKRAEKFQ